ncbi:Vegetative incompatibility protein HET-E-1 [Penicillium chrysogenum]|uniref:Mitochondrial division protein 1 n=1 Tax=Penicillium chrysogenum TaxID=5076 RepID=A0A167V604_PENCH|nr:Vegetative incompatibility protein HET-E-1 [Penicillium chrysogenum]
MFSTDRSCPYGQLDPEERDILSRVQVTAPPGNNEKNRSKTEAIIDEVIQIIEDYSKEYRQAGITIKWSTGEDVDLRKLSRKILNAALSFKDIVSTVVAFDPTHHAASAWAVVSLGLTNGSVVLLESAFPSLVRGEAMSLLGLASKAVGIINALQSNLEDANRFILKNVQVINNAPLQVYCSALVFAPRSSTIRRLFNSQRSSWISVLPQVEESWGTEPQILKGHSELVSSVAFSRDGQRIISGSYDKSIKLWDAQTGLGLQTHNYSCPIWSVAFSLDGLRIISCYSDDTIKFWDAQTGSEPQTVDGDCGWVE